MIPIVEPPDVDMAALRSYRLSRVTEQMTMNGVDLLVLVNPVSLRYAADWREYAMFVSRIPTYYLFVFPDGRLVMHGAYAQEHEFIAEFRPADYLSAFDGGLDLGELAGSFAAKVRAAAGSGATVAVERISPSAVQALEAAGLRILDGDPLMEQARSVKSEQELTCMRHSIATAEAAMSAMWAALEPGITENQLFAILHQTNVANDGDWIDGRMLCSGPRTNPWYQEASDKVILSGELVAFDTDMIGPFGYCADISRTWLVGGAPPTSVQRDLYRRAHAEVEHNASLVSAGMSFRELSDKAYRHDDEFVAHRYACMAHGVGLTDEYPKIYYRQDWERHGYDGVIEANTVLSIESFVGSERGGPGVKLEEMYLVTTTGAERLSSYPFEDWL